jgi:hypothetical protein
VRSYLLEVTQSDVVRPSAKAVPSEPAMHRSALASSNKVYVKPAAAAADRFQSPLTDSNRRPSPYHESEEGADSCGFWPNDADSRASLIAACRHVLHAGATLVRPLSAQGSRVRACRGCSDTELKVLERRPRPRNRSSVVPETLAFARSERSHTVSEEDNDHPLSFLDAARLDEAARTHDHAYV